MNAVRLTRLASRGGAIACIALSMLLSGAISARAALTLTGGIVLAEQGPIGATVPGTLAPLDLALATNGAVAISSGQLGPQIGLPPNYHYTAALNDGIYGNANSWIGGTGDAAPWYAGVSLGAAPVSVQSIAFGRSNVAGGDPCGICTDRNLGLYTLQYSTDPNPTGASSWSTIGTLDYVSAGGPNFSEPWRRHRYNFPAVNATGIRLLVPGTGIGGEGTAIDEIELYAAAGDVVPPPPPTPNVILSPRPGYGIGFNGNEGPAGAPVPDNLALASHGVTPFGSSEYGAGVHLITNINEGQYGNSHSWLSNFPAGDPNPYIGLNFNALLDITSIAFSRSNVLTGDPCGGGVCVDRALGTYTVQITTIAGGPDGSTPETDSEPENGWDTLGTITYQNGDFPFSAWLRHEFTVLSNGHAVRATGLRIKVSDPNIAIDELQVFGTVVPEPSSLVLAGLGAVALTVSARRRRSQSSK